MHDESYRELRAKQLVRLAELTQRFRRALGCFEVTTGIADWPGRRGVHSVEPPDLEPEDTVLARLVPVLKEVTAEIAVIEAEIPAEERDTHEFKALLEQTIVVHDIIGQTHLTPCNQAARSALDDYFTMHRIKAERLFVEMYGPVESMPSLPCDNPDPEGSFARVLIAVDYEGLRQGARRRFVGSGAPSDAGHVNPFTLARLLIERRLEPSVVEQVRVYRGRPSPQREPAAAAEFDWRAARWVEEGGGWLTVKPRELLYARRDRHPPKEKGIEVAIGVDIIDFAHEDACDAVIVCCDGDVDHLPTVEVLNRRHPGIAVEVARWEGKSRLQLADGSLKTHLLTETDFRQCADTTRYIGA